MSLFLFKIIVTPLLIGLITSIGRKWGTIVSGFLIGLPLNSGPVSLILAMQYGPAFAVKSAIGSLAGQISVVIFCLAYYWTSQRYHWPTSALVSTIAFFGATFVLNLFSWSLTFALPILLITTGIVTKIIPNKSTSSRIANPPAWDLPARMIIATVFVCVLTSVADSLGPQLSGLLSPFPTFSLIVSAFTHKQQGISPTARLLHGIVAGSIAYAGFFLIVYTSLLHFSIAATYVGAALAALCISGIAFYLSQWQFR